MSFPTEAPTAPPPSSTKSYPWAHRVNYKSGKTPAGFATKAMPEDVKAGFSYFDNEAKQNVTFGTFNAVVVASLAGVAGVSKDGDKYYNYYSNLVDDTRTDLLEVRMQGIAQPIASGLYSQIKQALPMGVGYTQVLICYVPEHKMFVALNLTVGLQHHLKAAIASATSTPVSKVNLFGLCELTSQYWGFRFTGGFQKVDKEGKAWTAGEMYFMPECSAFIIRRKPETEQHFSVLDAGSKACQEYVSGEQIRIAGAKPLEQMKGETAPTRTPEYFPAEEPAFVEVEAPISTDDLPF